MLATQVLALCHRVHCLLVKFVPGKACFSLAWFVRGFIRLFVIAEQEIAF